MFNGSLVPSGIVARRQTVGGQPRVEVITADSVLDRGPSLGVPADVVRGHSRVHTRGAWRVI